MGGAQHAVGVFEAQGSSFESEIWADIDTVRNSLGREGLLSSVTARMPTMPWILGRVQNSHLPRLTKRRYLPAQRV